ncbi:amino acid ABC transporter permease [Brevibacterium samyangense]|uniref:Amino acid ABC transporter permease n=1 Tax=Brevibacterium samyangense TaxID=366888 RepID=A0ABP5EPA7_9MICO
MLDAQFFLAWIEYFPDYLAGFWVSIKMTVLALLWGIPLAMGLALVTMSKLAPLRWLGICIVEVGRGIPALVFLYLVYFGLPPLGILFDNFQTSVLVLGFSTGCYAAEVFRATFESIPRGHHEAAAAVGLTRVQTFFLIVLPQAVKIVIPPIVGNAIGLFQATSLAYAIGVPELTKAAYTVASINYQYLSCFTLAALFYAAVSIPASLWLNKSDQPRQRLFRRPKPATASAPSTPLAEISR